MKISHLSAFVFSTLMVYACDGADVPDELNTENPSAAITAVSVTGEPGGYTFSVTIQSPDTGCEQYADWWDVFRPDGTLVYRRILAHSHVNEQPFTRSGAPVNVAADEMILVRAHMNSSGYGEQVFSGSIEQGLMIDTLDSSVAEELEVADPLPDSCAF